MTRISPPALGAYSDVPWQYPEFDLTEWKPRRSKYCVCIFVINENGRLHAQLEKMRRVSDEVDVLIADGGSTDGSTDAELLSSLGVRALLVKRGDGRLGAQMRMAFAYALSQGYEGVICVDGNNKDDVPQALPGFIQKLDGGFDHIQGSRYVPGGYHENTPFLRHWGVKLVHAPVLSLASGFRYTDTTNGFRAYSRRLLSDPGIRILRDELVGYELHYYLAIEAARRNYNVTEVPTTRVYPKQGTTPTKITGVRGNAKVLKILFRTALGGYRVR
jgi:glycosyltransferase involved in cell wall biosynthesis